MCIVETRGVYENDVCVICKADSNSADFVCLRLEVVVDSGFAIYGLLNELRSW